MPFSNDRLSPVTDDSLNCVESNTEVSIPDEENLTTEIETTKEELDLSKKEDCHLFNQNVETIYINIYEYEPAAAADSYSSLRADDISGRAVYERVDTVYRDINELVQLLYKTESSYGHDAYDARLNQVQNLYDEFIRLRNCIRDAYADPQNKPKSDGSKSIIPEKPTVRPRHESPNVMMGSKRKRRTMSVEVDTSNSQDVPISIHVTDKSKQQLQGIKVESKKPIIRFSPTTIPVDKGGIKRFIGVIEKQDPINEVIPKKIPTLVQSAPVHEKLSLTKKYLSGKRYLDFIQAHFSSLDAYERILDATITQMEQKTTDIFERLFDDKPASAFVYLQDKTISQVWQLNSDPDIKSVLLDENIKYETFILWVDMIEEMSRISGKTTDMTFGELFARWMIETDIENFIYQERSHNSQFE